MLDRLRVHLLFVQHALLPCRCLVDGIATRSRFEERQNSSELKLSLQAFKFDDGEEVSKTHSSGAFFFLRVMHFSCNFSSQYQVFIRCKLVAWNPDDLGNTKKACNYNEHHG